MRLLPALDVPAVVGRCLRASRVVFLLGAAGLPPFLLLFVGFGVVAVSFLVCSGGLGACGWACSFLASPLPSPLGCLLVLSGPVSPAGPSLRVSGCICNGPVVIPLAWRVVADWLVSSLRFMATKASALCGALPSPPCCGCCSFAPRCGTEVFALG